MVFYLKYRPQKIEELDSVEVRERLSKVLASKSLPHAFLFTGPKGLGKTSTARIVAKSINCTNKKEGFEPCGKCDTCQSITIGSSLDVLEIDGASNRGIDEIRDLREKIGLSPASSPKKIYIIDEVHMLTTEAFNALLKTLEEPPEHAVFVLCTTEPQKVPPTIISRCFHVTFKRASEDELISSFKRILKGEKIDIDKDALIDLARLSDGSFRDGTKLLEEISIVLSGKKITSEEVEKHFKTVNIGSSVNILISNLKSRDAKRLLQTIGSLSETGADMKLLTQGLIERLHSDLLRTSGVIEGESEFTTQEILKLLSVLTKAHYDVRFSVLPQIPLEIALLEWTSSGDTKEVVDAPSVSTQSKSTPEATEHVSPPDSKNDKILKDLIDKVNETNKSAAALLRGVHIEESGGIFKLATSFKFHKERLDDPKVRELINQAFTKVTGKDMKFEIVLKESR